MPWLIYVESYFFPMVSLVYMSRDMRFPTMWYVRPVKAQISLRICAVWSEPFLVARVLYECLATDRTSFGVAKVKMRLHRLIWVYWCQKTSCYHHILYWLLFLVHGARCSMWRICSHSTKPIHKWLLGFDCEHNCYVLVSGCKYWSLMLRLMFCIKFCLLALKM